MSAMPSASVSGRWSVPGRRSGGEGSRPEQRARGKRAHPAGEGCISADDCGLRRAPEAGAGSDHVRLRAPPHLHPSALRSDAGSAGTCGPRVASDPSCLPDAGDDSGPPPLLSGTEVGYNFYS